MSKRILLIAPFVPNDVRANWIPGGDRPAIDLPGTVMPLSLATLAALTPDDYEVDIWDECIRGKIEETTDLGKTYDIVGITGYIPHLARVKELAPLFRKQGIPVAVGGPGLSAAPHLMVNHCDVSFIGEAEATWPRFLKDFEKGHYKPVYRQIEKIDMGTSPIPDWSSIKDTLHLYANGCLQTTRGCPFDCEFCDIIILDGHKPRTKSADQMLAELEALYNIGHRGSIFIGTLSHLPHNGPPQPSSEGIGLLPTDHRSI